MKNNLYKALLTVTLAASSFLAAAQNASDIPLMVITPTQSEGLPSGAEAALKNKMTRMATVNGIGSMNEFSQFCLLVNMDLESKQIIGGAPVKHSQVVNFNFYIVDQFNENMFAATTVRAKGVGDSETKAFIQSIRQINERSAELADFLEQGKKKIIEYYLANCDKIIAKARQLALMKNYEEALFHLSQIPDVCTDCYGEALAESLRIYQLYLDDMCNQNIAKAKAAWAASQNSDGAYEAGIYLSKIYPDANCYGEAEALYKEIKAKVREDWDFVMKMYQDEVDLESQRISAIRDIGVAWGENQQPTVFARNFRL